MVAKPKLRKRINNFPTTVRNFFFRQAVQGKNYLEGIWWNDLKTDPIKTIAITMIIVVALPLLAWEIAKLAIASTIATIGITGVAAIVAMGVAFSRFGSDIMHSVKNLFSSPEKTPNLETTQDLDLEEYEVVTTGKTQAGKVKNPEKSVVDLAQLSAEEQTKLKIRVYVLRNYYAICYKYEINDNFVQKIQKELQNQGITTSNDLKAQLQAIQREIITETDRAIQDTTRELRRAQTLPYYDVENPTLWQRTAMNLVQFGQWCKSFVIAIPTSEEIFRQTYQDELESLQMARGDLEVPTTKRELSAKERNKMFANLNSREQIQLVSETVMPEIDEKKPSAPREVVLPATMQEEQDLATKSNLTYRSAARKDIFDVCQFNPELFGEVLPNQQMLEAAQQQVANHGQKLNDYLQELQQEYQRLEQDLQNVKQQQETAQYEQEECAQKITNLTEKNQETESQLQQEPEQKPLTGGGIDAVLGKIQEDQRKKATRNNAPKKVGIQKSRGEISTAQKRQQELEEKASQTQTTANEIQAKIDANVKAGWAIQDLIKQNSRVSEGPTGPSVAPPVYSPKDPNPQQPDTMSHSTTGGPAHLAAQPQKTNP